ncbi:hypothetical protein B0H14DRAFT_3492405 [Mycena olivaceomarginata]|nr:hypothetical protein B0H14DRAFT_3492405 [Mycena olivaceomarginata]
MSYISDDFPLQLHHLFSQPPKAPGRSGLHLYQAFAPPTLLTAAQGSRAQWITLISSFCSTNSSHSRPRLPGAADYTYFKLLLHHLFSQPPKAPGRSGLHLYQAFAPPTLLTAAQGSRAQWITLISSFCSTNSSHSRPRLPGAADYTYFKLLLHHLFSQPPKAPGRSGLHLYQAFAPPTLLTAAQGSRAQWITLISSFCSTNSSHSRPRLPGAVDYTYIKLLALVHIVRFADFNFHPALGPLALEQICPACALEVVLSIREEVVDLALKGGGADGRHLLKSAGSRGNEQGLTEVQICQFFVFGCGRVDPRVYDVGVGTDDERVLEDSGWWRRCPVFLGSGSTLPKNERIAARRWLIRPRIRPESKLQDKCFERTAALDVENTMCRVNGIGSNAGAWDAADRGGTLSESLGTGLTLPKNELRLQGAEPGSPTSPPPPAGGSAGYPHGVLVCPPRNGGGVTPAAAVLAQTHAVLTPALADAIWHVARAPAVEKLVDEHRPTFILWIVRGSKYFRLYSIFRGARGPLIPCPPRPLRPLAIPSPSSLISLLPFVLLSPSPPSLPSHLHLLSSPHLLFLLTTPYSFFSAIRRNAAPTYVPSEEDVLRACAKSTAIIETRFWMGGLI